MKIRKAIPFAGAIALLVAFGSLEAQQPIDNLLVKGEAVCSSGDILLTWTVANPKENGKITITSATETGVYEGDVDLRPKSFLGGTATGSDGPVPGDTKGLVTLTVDYVTAKGVVGQSTGGIYLQGCQESDDNDGSSGGDGH